MNDLNKDIVENSTDILEFSLDFFLKNGIIKEFPIVGSAVKIGFSVQSISDRIFLKKLETFLLHFEKETDTSVNKLIHNIATDNNYEIKVGENLILLIDRFSDLNKPEYLAKCFVAFIKKEISFDDFIRLGNAIDSSHSPDLKCFIKSPENEEIWDRLIKTGLTEISKQGISMTQSGSVPIYLSIVKTELGKTFLKIFNVNDINIRPLGV